MMTTSLLVGTIGPEVVTVSFTPSNGQLRTAGSTSTGSSASWICLSPDHKIAYVTDEAETYDGTGVLETSSGAIVVVQIPDKPQDPLIRLQTVLSHGGAPTHMSLSDDSKTLYVANYSGGSVSVYSVLETGLLKFLQVFDFNSDPSFTPGPNKDRQLASHAHCVVVRGDHVYCVDLGQDKIHQFSRKADGTLVKNPAGAFRTATPGTGPRHLAFHPNLPYAYVTNELDASVSVFLVNADGTLSAESQRILTIPAGTPKDNVHPSEIFVESSGKFLYVSNRHDSDAIVVYEIATDGSISRLQTAPSGGKTPRHLALSPDEKWIIASNQDSSSIDLFSRDSSTGEVKWVSQLAVPNAQYVQFV